MVIWLDSADYILIAYYMIFILGAWIKQQPFQIRNTYQQTRNTLVRIISWSLHHIWIVIESSLSQYISTYFFRCSRNVVSSAWMPGLPSRSRCVCGRGWRFTLTTVKPLSVWLRPWLRATLSPFNQVPWCAFSRRIFFLGGWNHEPCLMAWFTFFLRIVLFRSWFFLSSKQHQKKMKQHINITLQPSDFSAPKLPFL